MASPFPAPEKALPRYLSDPTYTKGFIMPPTAHPTPVHVILSQATSVITRTPLHMTFPEVWLNKFGFFYKDTVGEWYRITPWLLREILLKPHVIPEKFLQLRMVVPEDPMSLVPAHIPSFSDIGSFSKVVEILLTWWTTQMAIGFNFTPVPWDLEFICDPAPVLPRERKALSITKNWLMVQARSATDNVKWLRVTKPCNQLTLKCAWGISKVEGRMSGVKVKINSEIIYSTLASRMVTLSASTPQAVAEEILKLPPINPGMSILLWNARGVARPGFRRNINQLIRDHDPMIVIITETKVARPNIEGIAESLPFNSYETVEPVGYTGGILILWNEGLHSFTPITKEPRAIHGIIQVSNENPFFISALYANTKFKGRSEMWENLCETSKSVSLPWLVVGDFNEIAYAHEKIGGNKPKDYKMRLYREKMDDCNLSDLGYIGSKFTWFNKRKNQPIFERLDRCWASPNWITAYPSAIANNLPRLSSDHNPILLTLKPIMSNRPKKMFKFEPFWLAEHSFSPWVNMKWDGYQDNLNTKLGSLRSDLPSWVDDNCNLFKNKSKIMARLRGAQNALQLDPFNSFLFDLESKLSSELNSLLDQEEYFWQTRSRSNSILIYKGIGIPTSFIFPPLFVGNKIGF